MSAKAANRDLSDRDIAVVGMACRFPGANSVEEYWELLSAGRSAITELPPERWDVDGYYSVDAREPGKTTTRKGGYIDRPDFFDAGFFGVSPREARRMDPQQRMLLEVTWHALEDANLVPGMLAGTHVGVFMGVMGCEWGRLQFADINGIDGLTGPGSHDCISPNRISYHFDFKGPSVAYATACSSSLVSIHAAMRSLQLEECSLAVAGGVNLVMHPGMILFYTKAGLAAPDGVCKPFSRNADGLGRSDGIGAVVLRRLSDAQASGDRIYAVLRGGAVNQDGRSNGLTAPSRLGQEDLLRLAFKDAAVGPHDLQYIEAHGTGTVLGDLIEARALGSLMSMRPPSIGPCYIGSVKGNISHLEGASGIASVIKVALALKHGKIPASLHSSDLSPDIPFDEYRLAVPQRLMDWPVTGAKLRMAGVSSFGIGGTNAHLVLMGAPPELAQQPAIASQSAALPALLLLSAKGEAALKDLAQGIDQFFDRHPQADPAMFCDSWNACRSQLANRLALVVSSGPQLRKDLRAYARNGNSSADLIHASVGRREPKVAFVFSGQGANYIGMGRELYRRETAFREIIDKSEENFALLTGSSLKQVLFEDAALQRRAGCLQPAYFVFSHALAQLWRSWGIQPACVFGHSLGEYAAACAAGRLHFGDGLEMVAKRGALMEGLSSNGGMLAVDIGAEDLSKRLSGAAPRVVIAADNAPNLCVVSGPGDELDRLQSLLISERRHVVPLPVSHAFHSPQMDAILAEFESFADKIHPASPTEEIVFLSTTSGRAMDRNVALSGHDWASQIRQPVRFRECVLEAQKRGCNVFLEIGPDGTLGSLIRATLDNKVRSLASLDRKVDDWRMMLRAFGEMYCLGVALDIHRGVKAAAGSRRMELPKYPFQRQHYPLDVVDSTGNPASTQAGAPERDIAVNRVSARPAAASIDSPALDGANCDHAAVALSAIAKICGMDVDAIDLDQSFVHDLGFSSIMLAELTAALREKVPRVASIPLGFYFGGGSVGKFLQQSGLDSSATPLMQLSPLNGPQLLPANGAPALASNGAHALPAGFGDALVICEAWAKEFDRNVVRRVPRQWVHQHNNGNILLARQELVASRTVVGEASQDLMHPFFYDHAQDHVPGMYVIEVVRQLITASGHAYFGVEMTRKFVLNELNSQFDRFIEPEDPFFMVLDHAASRFNDGVMTDVDCVAHIVQHGGVVAQVRGRGRAMESNEYSRIRGDRAVVSNVGSATSEQSSSVASE